MYEEFFGDPKIGRLLVGAYEEFTEEESLDAQDLAEQAGEVFASELSGHLRESLDYEFTVSAADYVEFVVRSVCTEEGGIPDPRLADWSARLLSGEAEKDPRVEVFLDYFQHCIEDTRQVVRERAEALARYLEVERDSVLVQAFGPFPELVLFAQGNERYIVYFGDDTERMARYYVLDNLYTFANQPELLMEHSILPYGAEKMLEPLAEMDPETATEAIRVLLADEHEFAHSVIESTYDLTYYMTCGLARDGVLYEAEEGVRVFRIFDMDTNVVDDDCLDDGPAF